MANNAVENRSAQLTWPNIIITLSFAAMLVSMLTGGVWLFVSAQIAFLKEELSDIRTTTLRRSQANSSSIEKILDVLTARNLLFVSNKEFEAYLKLIDTQYARQQEINRQAIDAYQTVKSFEAWRVERDKRLEAFERRINLLEEKRP